MRIQPRCSSLLIYITFNSSLEMVRRFLYCISAVLVLLSFSSCSKDDNELKLKDNWLVEFSLSVNAQTFVGSIEGDKLSVHFPEGIELNDVVVHYTVSAGASISPDPQTVSDWSIERQFIVTSKTGESRRYLYKPVFNRVVEGGDVYLPTQADVDAFKSQKLSVVAGDLIIGTPLGEKITNLDSLEYLKEVGRSLIINSSYDGTDLSGLKNLERVGGVQLGSHVDTIKSLSITVVSLPSLSEVTGHFVVNCGSVEKVSIPQVTSVKGDLFLVSNSFKSIDASSLEHVGGSLIVRAATKDFIKETFLDFASFAKIEALVFNSLTTVDGSLEVKYFPKALKDVHFPKLTRVGHILRIQDLKAIASFTVSKLKEVGGIDILYCKILEQVSFPALTTCAGSFTVTNFTITDISIPSLVCQQGNMYFKHLKIKELSLNPDIDFNGFSLTFERVDDLERIVGPSRFNGSIYIDKSYEGDDDVDLSIEGISELAGSIFIDDFERESSIHLPFTQIEGTLSFKKTKSDLYVSNLRTLGDLYFQQGAKPSKEEAAACDFSSLVEIKRSCELELKYPWPCPLSALERIGGDFTIYLKKDYANNGSFTFPRLSEIVGDLVISDRQGFNPPDNYTLDLSGLQSVKSVRIVNQPWFTDYTMFSGLFTGTPPAISSEGQWSVTGCGYNPTYADMKAGKYTKQP